MTMTVTGPGGGPGGGGGFGLYGTSVADTGVLHGSIIP